MNDSQNWNIVGEQMKRALSDALQTGDFSVLNELVTQTVSDTLNDAGKHIAGNFFSQPEKKKANESYESRARAQQRQYDQKKKAQEEAHRLHMQQQKEAQMRKKAAQQALKQQHGNKNHAVSSPQKQTTALIPIKFKQIGNVSNVLYQVFGGIGFGISSLIAFFRLFAALAGGTTLAGWIINLLFIAGFFCMIRYGVNQRNRLARAKRYIQLCGGRMYGQIESLARDTGKSVRFVVKDILKMLSLGMFPEGHLDEKRTCFMLNDSIHQQYLDAEKSRIMREQEQIRAEAAAKQQSAIPTGTDGKTAQSQSSQMNNEQEAELNTMIAEGMECTRKLRELNDQIPGEVISEKLYRLENLLKDIFDSVREHPEQMHRMHKMMDYYLPTTLKLVEAYEDFDKISAPGPDIVAAKAEIERTMDIINQAFSELLSNLFQDAVLDATTDAQVLQTMLAREGLTKNIGDPKI
ncbi:MAG: 5-bromo-4-chloroindolyl phosphate hydrolysis family protein [Lachnospiraceae bacterium]|nr:5-bromo-4-chloroindolyl phosphate hydrolysis family protein [Lachnospiraceae bacterium]